MTEDDMEVGIYCSGVLEQDDGTRQAVFHSPFEEALANHLETHLGPCDQVIQSFSLGCHLYIFPPCSSSSTTEKKNKTCWTLVTMGLSGFQMPTEDSTMQRCELMLSLPHQPRQQTTNESINQDNFAPELLLWLANYVVSSNVWLKPGDGIGGNPFNGRNPMFEGTQLACCMLIGGSSSGMLIDQPWRCMHPYTHQPDQVVNFWNVVPITLPEFQYRSKNGTEALLECFRASKVDPIIVKTDLDPVNFSNV